MLSRLLTKLSARANPWREVYFNAVRGQQGIEIGGPSDIFRRRKILPLYDEVASLDACIFAADTLWSSNVAEGTTYEFSTGKPMGRQYIREATDLHGLADGAYDFVFASHVIEHVANPLKALAEWSRITRDGGTIVLVVPHKDGTFDHRRPVTTLEHVVDDLKNDVSEHDTTHLDEILRLHDLDRDEVAKPFESFRQRSLRNFENRGLHHHVFDTRLAVGMVDRAGLEIVSVDHSQPFHIMVLARKGHAVDNESFLAPRAVAYLRSPFVSDRAAKRDEATVTA